MSIPVQRAPVGSLQLLKTRNSQRSGQPTSCKQLRLSRKAAATVCAAASGVADVVKPSELAQSAPKPAGQLSTVIITGATSGLGLAATKALVKTGIFCNMQPYAYENSTHMCWATAPRTDCTSLTTIWNGILMTHEAPCWPFQTWSPSDVFRKLVWLAQT